MLNRGETVNALKRAISVGRVASYQAKQHEEMQAVADALSLLANLVMAWNTMKMQSVLDRWNARRSTAVPPGLIGRIAPTRTEGINLRGVFTFPIEQYQAQLLPSLPAAKSRAFGVQMARQNAEKRYFLSKQNGHCIQQVTGLPGIFSLVFAHEVPALLARKSREPHKPPRQSR